MLGERLRGIRERQGLSRDRLGRIADISGQQIYRYEINEQMPLGDTLARIADALGTSTDYLLGLTDDPIPQATGNDLSTIEQAIIEAWRRGDRLGAIRVIVEQE